LISNKKIVNYPERLRDNFSRLTEYRSRAVNKPTMPLSEIRSHLPKHLSRTEEGNYLIKIRVRLCKLRIFLLSSMENDSRPLSEISVHLKR